MTPRQCLAFVKKHGVVLESARGSVPSLAEAIAGERIRGSWWGHEKSHEIFAAVTAVRESSEVLVCRVVGGKVTFVHRRLWPALVRLADRWPRRRLAKVREYHAEGGRHATEEVPFPDWVPSTVQVAAEALSATEAARSLGSWVE